MQTYINFLALVRYFRVTRIFCICLAGLVVVAAIHRPAHAQKIDRIFESDLHRPVISDDAQRPRWRINKELLQEAYVDPTRCDFSIDRKMRLNKQPTFRIDPKPDASWGNVQWIRPVEAGRAYRFSGVYRNAGRRASDPPVFMPMYAFLGIDWLDVNGTRIATRDRLRSRPSTDGFWTTLEVQAVAPPGAVNARLLITAGYNSTVKDRKGLHAWFGDLRWGPVQLSPLTLDLWPRLLRTADEPFEIQIRRSHDMGIAWDGCLRVELLNEKNKVVRQWIAAKAVTIPWTIRTRLPKEAGNAEGWSVRVALDPYRPYQGQIDWQISEPIFVANSNTAERLQDGFFVIDGKKRFIVGAYHAQPQDYAILKDASFNTIITKHYDADEAWAAYEKLADMKLLGLATVGGGGQTRGNVPRTLDLVKKLKEHPALLAWSLIDEPTRKGIGPREIAWHSQWLQSIAPNVPTFLNCTGPYLFYRYASTVDIFATDPYPNADWFALATKYNPDPDISRVTRWLSLLDGQMPPGRGYCAVIEAFTHPTQRPPTNEELRSNVYQSLTGGATSIFYFAVRFDKPWYLPDQPLFETIREVNQHITELEPWLVEGRLPTREQPLKIDTDRPDQLTHATWLHEGVYLTIITNLSRETHYIELKNRSAVAMPDNITPTLELAPLEVKIIRYPAHN